MTKVTAHMSMSLDGYVAGPNGGPGNPLGDEGTRIQDWMFDLAAFQEAQGGAGGRVCRKRTATQTPVGDE